MRWREGGAPVPAGAAAPRAVWAVWAVWAATRAAMLTALWGVWRFPGWDVTPDVWRLYHGWYERLAGGAFPTGDVGWQYPPGAAAVMLAPGLLPFTGYAHAFYLLACAADAAVLAVLLHAPGTGQHVPGRPGPWLWTAGAAVLGPLALARYDVMVTAVAVAALAVAARHPRLAGALAGAGALLKGWPLLLLAGAAPGRAARRASRAAAAVVAGALLVCACRARGAFAFLAGQRARGVEVESSAAAPFQAARALGWWHGTAVYRYGSYELVGPYVQPAGRAVLAVSVAALCALVWWRVRARAFDPALWCDAAFAAVLVCVVTSRVISPQYLVWLLGLGASCLVRPGTVQRLPAALLLPACACTVAEFPLGFAGVVGGTLPAVAFLVVRDALLTAAALLACRGAWRSTVPARRPARPAAEAAVPAVAGGGSRRVP